MNRYQVKTTYKTDSMIYTIDAESESDAMIEAKRQSYEIFGINPKASYGLWSTYRPTVEITRLQEKVVIGDPYPDG